MGLLDQPLRGLNVGTVSPIWLMLMVGSVLMTSCGPHEDVSPDPVGLARLLERGPSLVADPSVRRTVLEESLVDPTNGYSRLRLQNYGLGTEGWDALPERNFPVRPAVQADIGRFRDAPFARTPGNFEPVFDRDAFAWTDEALVELGRRAFHEYPLNLDATLAAAFESDAAADEAGLWRSKGRVGGMVRARLPDSSEWFATTCATCHASVDAGELVDGRTNSVIDRNRISRMFHGLPGTEWGPGRVDVTDDQVTNPAAITDLRAIRYQNRLHWAATLYNSPEALAVRVETLMITSAREQMRPPREVAVAIAYYLWTLGEAEVEPDRSHPGAAVFDAHCAGCHFTDGTTAEPVPIESIGTDPIVGASTERGTGAYRVPSLYRVGTRTQFLHEGKVKTLEHLFDAVRLNDVPGHEFGLTLGEADTRALIEFLRSF